MGVSMYAQGLPQQSHLFGAAQSGRRGRVFIFGEHTYPSDVCHTLSDFQSEQIQHARAYTSVPYARILPGIL